MRKDALLALVLLVGTSAVASAQSTLMPAFSTPIRSYARNEKGLSISFPDYGYGFEGLYGVVQGSADIRFRGGVLLDAQGTDDVGVLFGAELRTGVLSHNEDFPADGSLILGAGVSLGNVNLVAIPVGLSLGRRLNIEDSNVSIVPFVQPTGTLVAGDLSDFYFSLGLGADFHLTRSFVLRVSVGLGDVDGVSFGAVWVN